MKDKLIKNHHKAPYYLMRRLLIAVSILLLASACVAIPVSISVYSKTYTVQVVQPK